MVDRYFNCIFLPDKQFTPRSTAVLIEKLDDVKLRMNMNGVFYIIVIINTIHSFYFVTESMLSVMRARYESLLTLQVPRASREFLRAEIMKYGVCIFIRVE